MFHSFPSSSSSSSSSPASTNYQYNYNSSSYNLFDNNANMSSIYLPSYFASYSHLRDANNDSSDSKEMQLGHETTVAELAAGAKASRYSPEERKERIERYRNKRNLRNFQKKITYECRKTLADSRPRVRGRFAKNAETESESDTAESSSGNANNADAWWHMEADHHHQLMNNNNNADRFEAESGGYYDDDELWAHLVSDFSANI